jgi:hypothetical protein
VDVERVVGHDRRAVHLHGDGAEEEAGTRPLAGPGAHALQTPEFPHRLEVVVEIRLAVVEVTQEERGDQPQLVGEGVVWLGGRRDHRLLLDGLRKEPDACAPQEVADLRQSVRRRFEERHVRPPAERRRVIVAVIGDDLPALQERPALAEEDGMVNELVPPVGGHDLLTLPPFPHLPVEFPVDRPDHLLG